MKYRRKASAKRLSQKIADLRGAMKIRGDDRTLLDTQFLLAFKRVFRIPQQTRDLMSISHPFPKGEYLTSCHSLIASRTP